jgi:hypothetical protein
MTRWRRADNLANISDLNLAIVTRELDRLFAGVMWAEGHSEAPIARITGRDNLTVREAINDFRSTFNSIATNRRGKNELALTR